MTDYVVLDYARRLTCGKSDARRCPVIEGCEFEIQPLVAYNLLFEVRLLEVYGKLSRLRSFIAADIFKICISARIHCFAIPYTDIRCRVVTVLRIGTCIRSNIITVLINLLYKRKIIRCNAVL